MTNVVIVEGDKTFGEGDDGTLQRVIATATLTIPADATHQYLITDWIDVFRDTADTVSVVPATGVTLSSAAATINKQCGFARFQKIADNKWIGWGDLG